MLRGRQLLREQRFDALLTISPPHSTHLAGLALHRLFPEVPWIAQLHDPWVSFDAPPTDWALQRGASYLERQVLSAADEVLLATDEARSRYLARYPELPPGKLGVLVNGYDPVDFPPRRPTEPASATCPTAAVRAPGDDLRRPRSAAVLARAGVADRRGRARSPRRPGRADRRLRTPGSRQRRRGRWRARRGGDRLRADRPRPGAGADDGRRRAVASGAGAALPDPRQALRVPPRAPVRARVHRRRFCAGHRRDRRRPRRARRARTPPRRSATSWSFTAPASSPDGRAAPEKLAPYQARHLAGLLAGRLDALVGDFGSRRQAA